MKIIDLYKHLLKVAGLNSDKEGFVSAGEGEESIPFNVKGKRLVLPTKEQLANNDGNNKIIFHPLSENTLKSESDVMQRFRTAINIRLNYVIAYLLEELMVIGTSVKMHSKLSPDQAELLTVLKDADEKSLTALQNILKSVKIDGTGEKSIVHIYIKRAGIVDDKRYSRAAIVSFPLYEELTKADKKVLDVGLRNKDKEVIINLLEFLFTKIKEPMSYNKGSNCDIAPTLDSLMKAVIDLASCINNITDVYSEFISDSENIRYNDEWVSIFDNLGQMLAEIRSIPMQSGNEGVSEPINNQVQNTLTNVTSAPAPTQATQAMYQPPIQPITQFQQPQSTVISGENGINFEATMRARGMSTVPQSFHVGYQRPTWGQPVNNLQAPINNFPYQQPFNNNSPL